MKQRVQKTYSFADQTINLHGYKATCTVTDKSKGFHHSYLANLIVKKYVNNFAHFEDTYVSKEGRGIIRAEEAIDREDNKLAQVALRASKEDAVKKYKELKRFYRHIKNVRDESKYLDALPSRQTEYVKTVLAA
jgi:hypothetical protein